MVSAVGTPLIIASRSPARCFSATSSSKSPVPSLIAMRFGHRSARRSAVSGAEHAVVAAVNDHPDRYRPADRRDVGGQSFLLGRDQIGRKEQDAGRAGALGGAAISVAIATPWPAPAITGMSPASGPRPAPASPARSGTARRFRRRRPRERWPPAGAAMRSRDVAARSAPRRSPRRGRERRSPETPGRLPRSAA